MSTSWQGQFGRCCTQDEVGLAVVRRIVSRHVRRVWAEAGCPHEEATALTSYATQQDLQALDAER